MLQFLERMVVKAGFKLEKWPHSVLCTNLQSAQMAQNRGIPKLKLRFTSTLKHVSIDLLTLHKAWCIFLGFTIAGLRTWFFSRFSSLVATTSPIDKIPTFFKSTIFRRRQELGRNNRSDCHSVPCSATDTNLHHFPLLLQEAKGRISMKMTVYIRVLSSYIWYVSYFILAETPVKLGSLLTIVILRSLLRY